MQLVGVVTVVTNKLGNKAAFVKIIQVNLKILILIKMY
jgi:hypothetical protein